MPDTYPCQRAEGRPASGAATFPAGSPRPSAASPGPASGRPARRSPASAGSVASAAPPPAGRAPRRPAGAAAATPGARETVPGSPPRGSRGTASRPRGRDTRPPRPAPAPPASVVAAVTVHLRRGRGPLTRCPVRPWAGGVATDIVELVEVEYEPLPAARRPVQGAGRRRAGAARGPGRQDRRRPRRAPAPQPRLQLGGGRQGADRRRLRLGPGHRQGADLLPAHAPSAARDLRLRRVRWTR